jgi:hypothetical protein
LTPREAGPKGKAIVPEGDQAGMNARLLALLALAGALLLAGCTFKSENDDGESDTTISAGDGGDDDRDSPSASVGAVLSVLGALLLRRRAS